MTPSPFYPLSRADGADFQAMRGSSDYFNQFAIHHGGQRTDHETKPGSAPKMTRSIRSAHALLNPTEIAVVHAGACKLADRVRAIPAEQVFATVAR